MLKELLNTLPSGNVQKNTKKELGTLTPKHVGDRNRLKYLFLVSPVTSQSATTALFKQLEHIVIALN